jgi:putative membrane protein
MESEERRLHPTSPLFVLGGSLRQFAIPLVVLLLTGKGDRNEFISAIIVALLALYSIAEYFTFRFRIDSDGVVIRSGVFVKSVVHVPYKRIQNVTVEQSLWHRIVGVAEVELESAGGAKPEGRMRVLAMADAVALEALIREQSGTQTAAQATAAAQPVRTLIEFDTGEIVRLGVISNRGFLVVGAAIGAILQAADSETFERVAGAVGRALFGWSRNLQLQGSALFAGIAVLVVFVILLLFGFSVLLALIQYDAFRLTDHGKRLRVERGLFTRVRGALLRRRIQSYTVRETLFHRWFRRRSLRVDSAASIGDAEHSLRDIVPIAPPDRLDALIDDFLGPAASWPPATWHSLHPAAWRRRFVPMAVIIVLLAAFAVWISELWGLVVLAFLPLVFIRARMWARHARYADEGGVVAMREGWLDRKWRIADAAKLQGAVLKQSPFDRRRGMATIAFDTAGATGETGLTIPYLPEADARVLVDRLMANA